MADFCRDVSLKVLTPSNKTTSYVWCKMLQTLKVTLKEKAMHDCAVNWHPQWYGIIMYMQTCTSVEELLTKSSPNSWSLSFPSISSSSSPSPPSSSSFPTCESSIVLSTFVLGSYRSLGNSSLLIGSTFKPKKRFTKSSSGICKHQESEWNPQWQNLANLIYLHLQSIFTWTLIRAWTHRHKYNVIYLHNRAVPMTMTYSFCRVCEQLATHMCMYSSLQ